MSIRLLSVSAGAFHGATIAAGTLAVSSGAASAGYLNDGVSSTQWLAAAVTPQTITVDTTMAGSPPAASVFGLLNHNLLGVRVGLYGSPDGSAWTLVADAVVTADPFFVLFTTATHRYWQVRIPTSGQPNPAAPAQLGELLVGAPVSVENPTLPSGKPRSVANVAHDRSPAGYPWNTRKGPARRRYDFTWNALPDADYATLLQVWSDCGEGTAPLLLTDQLGATLWVTWEELSAPQALGAGLQQVAASFEEVPA